MNKLFRFLDICREGLSRRNDRLLQGTARRRPEKRYRKFLHSTVLRIEGLEERQLLAIMAGAEFPEYDAPAQTGENIYEVIIGGFDTTDAPPPAAAYEVVATNIAQINAYFADEAYVPVKTKDYILYFSGGVNPDNNGYRYYANMVDFYCTVTTELGIVPENIFILYADGTDPAVDREDGFNSDMSFATVQQMNVYSATMANLTEAMDIISSSNGRRVSFSFLCLRPWFRCYAQR